MKPSSHDHTHTPNRFGVIPTPLRLDADVEYTGKGVTITFLDSGFYPHPDLSRIVAYHDVAEERRSLLSTEPVESWQWHGTQTAVAAAGNGRLSDGVYRSLFNGQRWIEDPSNGMKAPDNHGGLNSVLVIE
jgi:serine protease AprX